MLKKLSFSDDTIDTATPKNAVLSAKYRRSFAYLTIRDRLPVTVTNVIDHLVRDKEKIISDFGEQAKEESKEIIGKFSKLKNELQTNKPFELLTSDGSDVQKWNEYQRKEAENEGEDPKWFSTSWLYAECYFYRRIRHAFELRLIKERDKYANLWGNQYDLSRPIGSELTQGNDPLKNIELLQDNLLVDESENIWDTLAVAQKNDVIVGKYHIIVFRSRGWAMIIFIILISYQSCNIVNDNAGYELFSDMCLADALCTFSLADRIRFYVKALPWFISDTLKDDVHWILRTMLKLSNRSSSLPTLAERWEGYFQSGKWTIIVEDFWTLPHVYSEMKSVEPKLYAKLSEANLIVFKGDLNYRKLLGETNWSTTESFSKALQGFHPAPLVTLRTVKADLICGLKPGQAEIVAQKSPNWLITGDYAVIQFDG
ncbi:Protein-glutamate O-methyltransferase [Blattella germanica]|nr:Protein-glutamate O-methyltransferase [Blattella germanica]